MSVAYDEVPIGYLAKVTYGMGQPPPLTDDETGVPILRATNINRGRITTKDLQRAKLEDLPLKRAPLLEVGEILVVRSGAYTGDSALVTEPWGGSAPGYDLRLTPLPSVEPRFLAWALLSRPFTDQVELAKMRAAQPHLNAQELASVSIPLPDLDTQRRCADFLDGATQRIDRLVDGVPTAGLDSSKGLIARFADLLGERRAALITAAVTGRLNVDEYGEAA